MTALFMSFMIRAGFRGRIYSRKQPLGDWLKNGYVLRIKEHFRKIGYQTEPDWCGTGLCLLMDWKSLGNDGNLAFFSLPKPTN